MFQVFKYNNYQEWSHGGVIGTQTDLMNHPSYICVMVATVAMAGHIPRLIDFYQ